MTTLDAATRAEMRKRYAFFPEVLALLDALDAAENERDIYKGACKSAGVCMACVLRTPEPFGCTDCLNTGYEGGDPKTQIVELERRNSDLQAANNRLLERAREAERKSDFARRGWALAHVLDAKLETAKAALRYVGPHLIDIRDYFEARNNSETSRARWLESKSSIAQIDAALAELEEPSL